MRANCPFCKHPPGMEEWETPGGFKKYAILCDNPRCDASVSTPGFDTIEEAEKAWDIAIGKGLAEGQPQIVSLKHYWDLYDRYRKMCRHYHSAVTELKAAAIRIDDLARLMKRDNEERRDSLKELTKNLMGKIIEKKKESITR